MTSQNTPNISRRGLLRGASFGLGLSAVGGILSACGKAITGAPVAVAEAQPHTQHANPTAAPAAQTAPDYAEMDRMHVEGVQKFVAGVQTKGTGNQLLEPVMDGDVKVFNITAEVVQHEIDAGKSVEAWAYNGQIPGPQIRVTEGDKVRLVLTNKLPESTAIHFHGLLVPNSVDGVPGVTQEPVRPGETHSYEFTVRNSGSHMYHSHHNAAKQCGKGLLGTFIVDPKVTPAGQKVDADFLVMLNDQLGGFTINGKGFPATAPLTAKVGEKIRIRYMNQGLMVHPMHLHGFPQLVVAKDGWDLPQPYRCDTVNIAPGERYDVIVECEEAGVWAFHCHVLNHAESEHGMFGMVTALIVA